jgi:hypothetical protein
MTALWAASTRRACSRCLLTGVIACLSLASTRPTLAADEISDCPRLSEVVAALGQVVTADVAQAAASEIVIRDLGSSWQIEVRARASSYAEPARNCAERARVAAVFAALALDPPDRDDGPELDTSATRATPTARPLSFAVQVAPLLALVAGANLPLGAGGQVRFTVSGEHLGFALGAEAAIFSKLDASKYGASITRSAFDLSARASWSPGRVGFAAELGPYLAHLRVRGADLYESRSSNHVDAGARAALIVGLRGRWAPFLSAEATFSARRLDLRTEPSGTLSRVPPLWFGLSAGAALDM